jgi:sugar-specific transcriptional regulator TrmB
MNPPSAPVAVGPTLRTLLDLDRTLTPSDRKLLEVLLLRPGASSARELSRRTSTNLQALYGALDRLERRGFVVRDRRGAATWFRCSHPSVILHSLVEPGRRAAALASELEQPLGQLYAADGADDRDSDAELATTTSSSTAASSWLIDLVGRAVGEIWFLGNESLWFAPAPALEREIARRRDSADSVRVRMLVPPPEADDARVPHHARLERAGVAVRYSDRFAAPTVIVDRRWLLLRSGRSGGARKGAPVYVRIDSPDLCRDLLTAGEDAWSRSGGIPSGGAPRARPETPEGTGVVGRPSRSGPPKLTARSTG